MIDFINPTFVLVSISAYLMMATICGYYYSTRVDPSANFELMLSWPVAVLVIVCIGLLVIQFESGSWSFVSDEDKIEAAKESSSEIDDWSELKNE